MLELKNVCFTRDNKKILDNINLKIDTNKFIAITGPNGSGKSTLVKMIMGIEKPDSGEIIFDGKDITNLKINERANLGISFAFQQPVKFKGITVYDLLKIASKKNITKKEACEVLSRVGLCAKEYVDREVNGSLSGGIADEVILMRRGKIEKIGSSKEILENNIKNSINCCKVKKVGGNKCQN